jgi:oligopeptidase A
MQSNMDLNPLIGIRLPIPFAEVRPADVEPAVDQLIQDSRQRLAAIVESQAPRTWTNTAAALDESTESLDFATGIVRHLEAAATTPQLRDAHNEVQPRIAEFYAGIPLDEGLWRALREYAATEEAAALTGVRGRYLAKTIDAFRRAGAELDTTGKQKLQEMDVELATITMKFAQNVLDATARFEYVIEKEEDLAGLPASAVAAARQSAEAKGLATGWRFTLQQPSYLAVVTFLDNREVRERFWRAYNYRAPENAALIQRILELRQAKARLLGFAHFADLVLVERMAKTGAAAQRFISGLESKTRVAFERENRELAVFAGATLEPWDISYYAEKKRVTEYAFEEEDLRPYFPLDRVVEGMFELVHRLYGITVRPAGPVPLWHEDVKYYEIVDDDGTLLGAFYADWHPRETKRGGAWMDAFLQGRTIDGSWRPHVGLMCGNLTAPIGGKPALLTHRDVETIFHEFGHLLHCCLSRVEIRGMSGTSVAWDFVELPSQIMENWCWERECLDLFARHWQTGAAIPEDLFQKMVRARTFRSANGQMRQLGFACVDLALHIGYNPERDGGVLDYCRAILQRFSAATLPEGYAMIAAFTHLFADPVGYGSGYYSYKWAEVLDADAFSRFRRDGIFSREAGMAFRRTILERGDSEDPADLFRAFMGRDPDPQALMTRLGLAAG